MAPKAKPTKAREGSANVSKVENGTVRPGKPNWPSFGRALLPAEDLTVHTLLDHQIFTIPQLWTASLCKTYVTFLATLPLTTTPGRPKRGEAVRVNDRFQVDDADFAELLWSTTSLKSIVEHISIDGQALSEAERQKLWGGDVLGLNSNIRIYRYSKGQFFDQHCKLYYSIRQDLSVFTQSE